ncbi:RNA polymerase sigma factor [Gynurincola endophyticus]|uniref:RNA polymerase sigma factor n=1 Tax=Gynurincola endophyticus TaxID=2479004 RepID=UPI001F4223C8|nr:sigma-70 family RNA polymerase sigma factor [Gynurincola endophyticus]
MANTSGEILLLEGLLKNERTAIETIYKDNYRMVQQLVLSNNGSEDDAKDVFQETLMVLYERLLKRDFELNCLLKTYLYAVAKRIWLKKLQRNVIKVDAGVLEEELPDIGFDIQFEQQQQQHHLNMRKAMLELGEPCKSLIEAFYIQKKSMQDIADLFGYTNADNAKNQKYKCLTRLKKLFFKVNQNSEL